MLWKCALLFCLILAVANSQYSFSSNGSSGSLCGAHRCLAPAVSVCIKNSCVCQPPASKGLGIFVCLPEDEDFCVIYNDPTIQTFSGYRSSAPLYWKFLAAHLKTRLIDAETKENLDGECRIKIFPFGKKLRGKVTIGGFVFESQVTYKNSIENLNYLVTAIAHGGYYTFTYGGNTRTDSGPPYSYLPVLAYPDISGGIGPAADLHNNMFGINASFCGLKVLFRPVDTADRFTKVAGLQIIAESRSEPEYLDIEASLCCAPYEEEDMFEYVRLFLANLTQLNITKKVAALYRVLTQTGIKQDFPGASPNLNVSLEVAASCGARHLATGLHYCIFLLDIPRLVNCLDPSDSGNVILGLFSNCLLIFCRLRGLNNVCPTLKANIMINGCHRHIADGEITIFTEGVCP